MGRRNGIDSFDIKRNILFRLKAKKLSTFVIVRKKIYDFMHTYYYTLHLRFTVINTQKISKYKSNDKAMARVVKTILL